MHGIQRLVSTGLLVVLAGLIAGCSSINVPSWDPTDLLDFLDSKKRAVGERRPVFPGGIPGVSQGVPPDLVRGTPEHQAAMAAVDSTLAPPVEAQPVDQARPQLKKRVASKPPTRITVRPNQLDEPNGEDAGSADTEVPPPASPPPPRKRSAKKPAADQATAPDQASQQAAPGEQQSQSTLRGPLPSGSFQR